MTLVLGRILHSPIQGLLRAHFQHISSPSFALIIPFPNMRPTDRALAISRSMSISRLCFDLIAFSPPVMFFPPFLHTHTAHFRPYNCNLFIFTPCKLMSKRPTCAVRPFDVCELNSRNQSTSISVHVPPALDYLCYYFPIRGESAPFLFCSAMLSFQVRAKKSQIRAPLPCCCCCLFAATRCCTRSQYEILNKFASHAKENRSKLSPRLATIFRSRSLSSARLVVYTN